MKIETQTRDDHQVRLVAEFESDQFDKYKHQAARKIANETRIPGFRPGKAPFDVVRRMVGEKAITEQALDLLVDEVYPQVIKEADIHPYGPGSLDEIVQLDPPTLAFLVPLSPAVELGDYRAVRMEYLAPEVSDKDLEDAIERGRASYATVEPAERAAAEGDLVYLNLHGHLTHPVEDETVDVFKDSPAQVWIRSDEEQPKEEWPYPGFARDMLGVTAGEEKSLVHVFPEDASEENLRGREVEFHVHVESVKSMKLPELDDEFSHLMGEYQTVDEMRKGLRERLEQTKKEDYDEQYFINLTDKIRETAVLHYPPQAVEEESESVLNSIKNDLARQNLDFESYLKIRNTDKDTFMEKEIKPVAIKRLERSLILEEIGRAESLKLNVEDVTNMVARTLSYMQETGDLKRARGKLTQDQFTNALAMDAASKTMNRQVLDRIKAIATGQDIAKLDAESSSDETVDAEAIDVVTAEPETEVTTAVVDATPNPVGDETVSGESVSATPEVEPAKPEDAQP